MRGGMRWLASLNVQSEFVVLMSPKTSRDQVVVARNPRHQDSIAVVAASVVYLQATSKELVSEPQDLTSAGPLDTDFPNHVLVSLSERLV